MKVVPPIVAAVVVGITLGITYPLFTALLTARGLSGTAVGVSGAMTPLGMIATAPFVPALARAFGVRRVTMAALLGMSAVLAALSADFLWTAGLRALLGAGAVTVFVLSETWISQVVAPSLRARTLTVYTALLSVGFAVGPLLLTAGTTVLFTTAVLAPLIAFAVLAADKHPLPPTTSGRLPVATLLRGLSLLLVPVLAVAVFDTVTLQFLPAYGTSTGLSPSASALLLTGLLVGQVVLLYPLGWLADHVDTRLALLISLSGGALGALLLPFLVTAGPLGLLAVGAWGGIAFAGYPLALTLLGDDHAGHNLVLANSAFAVVWGLGGVLGPPYAGTALDLLGPHGLPAALATLFTAAVAVLLFARTRKPTTTRELVTVA